MASHRNRRLEVRVTERERAAISARSRRAGLTASEYVRRRALGDDGRPRLDVDAAALSKALADLKHAGSNVNQIARALNARGAQGAPAGAVGSALARLGDAASLVSAALAIVRNQ